MVAQVEKVNPRHASEEAPPPYGINLEVVEGGRGMPRPYECGTAHFVGAGHARPAANQYGQT